jgi:tRNA dimethylallyltransferase
VRRQLVDELEAGGLGTLAARLAELDPSVASRTDLRNPRRVLRALERVEAGGGAAAPRAAPYAGPVALLGISRPRDELYRRIDRRAASMFAGGLLDEVRALRAAGLDPDLVPMTGHGYREAMRVLAGEWSIERAVDVTARHTRQYAKRQLSWFGRDRRIAWLAAGHGPADDPALVDRAAVVLRALLT